METNEKKSYVDYSELELTENRAAQVTNSEAEDSEQSQEVLYPDAELLAYPEVSEGFEFELDYFDAEKQEEKLWQARTGLDNDTLCAAIETIIFMSDRPMALAKIRKYIDEEIPLRAIHEAIERLQEEYESRHHGLRLMEVAEGYQFRTKATYSKYVQDLFNVNSLVLTPTALEVLATIAYKQPVSKTEVDKIRGVDSSHIVRGLMDKRLVKVTGRSEELGRPALYGTTQEFLEVFNLADLSQLPPEHELEQMAEESVGKISDIKGLVHSGDKKKFKFDEMDELDELSHSIKTISSDTDFTKSVKVEEKKRFNEKGEEVKSAFELLEEYVDRQQILKANNESVHSELFTPVTSAEVIHDLSEGPFNVPENEDDEDFQMIDLETGEPIVDDDQTEQNEENNEEVVYLEDLEDEKQQLAQALDEAFDRLTSSSETLSDEQDLDEKHQDFVQKAQDLDNWVDGAVDQAKDLDIDLDFLKKGSTETKKSEENTDSNETP